MPRTRRASPMYTIEQLETMSRAVDSNFLNMYFDKEESYLQEGSDIKIINGDNVVSRKITHIQDDMAYWDDSNDEFSFASLGSFTKVKNEFILVL